MAIVDGQIRCGRCGEMQALDMFAPRFRARGHGTCRVCANQRNRDYEARNREQVTAARRAWVDANRSKVRERGLASYYRNADERRAKARAAYQRPEAKAAKHATHVARRFGLSAEEYTARLEQQNGCCALCSNPPGPSRRLAVDHDHATGAVRGLLCTQCNTALGRLGDSCEALERVLAYLRRGSPSLTPLRPAAGWRPPRMTINLLGGIHGAA